MGHLNETKEWVTDSMLGPFPLLPSSLPATLQDIEMKKKQY